MSIVKKAPLKCLFSALLFLVSCGKKPSGPSKISERQPQTVTVGEAEETLAKQAVVCEEGEACPNYLVKVVAIENKVPRFCTGFLVNAKTIATSTSCLPQLLRLKGMSCSQDVTFFFPKAGGQEAERVACHRVVQVSDLGTSDPALWRDDVTFLELPKEMVSRRSLVFSREGLQDQKEFTTWGVEQVDDRTAFIRRQNCLAVHGSYVNPLADKEFAPNMLLSDCAFKKGSMGAPILDARGRVRAMISQPMDLKLKAYIESTGLLTEPLKEMLHATNFSCAPTIFDTTVSDERECTKPLNPTAMGERRKEIFGRQDSIEKKRKELEDKVSADTRYMNFEVKLVLQGDSRRADIVPRCFKEVSKWINTINTRGSFSFPMSFPQVSLKTTMDGRGRIGVAEVANGKIDVTLQFSAKQLKAQKVSDVTVWNNNLSTVYEALSENCR